MLNCLKFIKKMNIFALAGILLFFSGLGNIAQAAEINDQIKIDGQMIELEGEQGRWLLPIDFLERKELPQRQFPQLEEIDCLAYIVTDLDTGEVLLEQGETDMIAYPASMTKVLTAITVLECPDFALDKPVTFSEHALDLPAPESVRSGYELGMEITTDEALHLLMVASANDCARALAETYGGTEENFVVMMNAKAEEIGADFSHMVDAAGFGLEDHFFTPRDLAKIIQYSMKNEIFRELVSTKEYIASYHLPGANSGIFQNSNKLLLQGDRELASTYLHTYDGVKTGTTDLAGYCLSATVHTYDGRHLCGIIFNGSLANSSAVPNIAVLLRTVLEEAARKENCPEKADAVRFLAENPSLFNRVREVIFENTLDDFVRQEYLTTAEKENMINAGQQPSSAREEGTGSKELLDYFSGKDKDEDEQNTAATKKRSSITIDPNSSDLKDIEQNDKANQTDQMQSAKFFQNPRNIIIIAAIIILIAILIYLIYRIFAHRKRSNE